MKYKWPAERRAAGCILSLCTWPGAMLLASQKHVHFQMAKTEHESGIVALGDRVRRALDEDMLLPSQKHGTRHPAMDGWRKSSGHRANMLGKDYTEMGAGVAQSKSGKWYFVQVFGKPAE